ncbi:MAG: glycine cleavage system aminomethyltransferase GcvT [Halioglobus sp.]
MLKTSLHALHVELGAKMVPFAGYDMPVQYALGIIKEHQHTRAAAGLFDVSHMGQLVIEGSGAVDMLESVVPVDIKGLEIGRQAYALLTNEQGGVLDDLMIARWSNDKFFLVVNAACKVEDIAYLTSKLSGQSLTVLEDQALLALQGPKARSVMKRLHPDLADMVFMQAAHVDIEGVPMHITCSGYTGEDGYEISLSAEHAEAFARQLLSYAEVEPIGLGARDSLRLEAGLCLYGHELSPTIDPVTAGLTWSISKPRRADGERAGGFPGAERVFERMQNKPARARVGLAVTGKRPVRDGQLVCNEAGDQIGEVCSAAFGASLGGPIAMAYIERQYSEPGTALTVLVRDKPVDVTVVKMPFIKQRYFRG